MLLPAMVRHFVRAPEAKKWDIKRYPPGSPHKAACPAKEDTDVILSKLIKCEDTTAFMESPLVEFLCRLHNKIGGGSWQGSSSRSSSSSGSISSRGSSGSSM